MRCWRSIAPWRESSSPLRFANPVSASVLVNTCSCKRSWLISARASSSSASSSPIRRSVSVSAMSCLLTPALRVSSRGDVDRFGSHSTLFPKFPEEICHFLGNVPTSSSNRRPSMTRPPAHFGASDGSLPPHASPARASNFATLAHIAGHRPARETLQRVDSRTTGSEEDRLRDNVPVEGGR